MGRVCACVWSSCDVKCAWLMNGRGFCVAIHFDSMDQCTPWKLIYDGNE